MRTRLTLAAAALAIAAGCGGPQSPHVDRTATRAAIANPVGAASVHDLNATWHDQNGNARTLASTGGRVRLLALVYTHCTVTCPLTISEMKRIATMLSDKRDTVSFVLVSLDPVRDTPERLREFARTSVLPESQWTLLTGKDGDVRELAAALGIRYKATGGGNLSHSNVITILDRDGVIVHQQIGFGNKAAESAKVLKELP